MRAALVDRYGRVSQRIVAPTLAHRGRDDVVGRFLATVDRVASSHAPGDSLIGIGVSLASPTDPQTGVMHNPPNLSGWDGYSLKPVLETRMSLRCSLGNDASLATLAEHVHGAGRGYRHMLYMTLSTGIGGGIIVDGNLYTGFQGSAGEFGHISISEDGPMCNCGNIGCLEALASGTAVARIAQEKLASGEGSVLTDLAGGSIENVDARMVADAAVGGDRLCRSIMHEVATNLGRGIINLLHAFDPEVVVIGGGMSASLDLLLPGISQEIGRHAMVQQRGRVPLVKSELGDNATLIGAAALAFEAYERGGARP